MWAIIGKFETYKIFTFAKASGLIPAHPCTVRLWLIHNKNKTNCLNQSISHCTLGGCMSTTFAKCILVRQSAYSGGRMYCLSLVKQLWSYVKHRSNSKKSLHQLLPGVDFCWHSKMHNLNRKGEIAPPCPTPVLPVCSVVRTIWYITHLYGRMAFVKALLYLCRSSMVIQNALIPCNGRLDLT